MSKHVLLQAYLLMVNSVIFIYFTSHFSKIDFYNSIIFFISNSSFPIEQKKKNCHCTAGCDVGFVCREEEIGAVETTG